MKLLPTPTLNAWEDLPGGRTMHPVYTHTRAGPSSPHSVGTRRRKTCNLLLRGYPHPTPAPLQESLHQTLLINWAGRKSWVHFFFGLFWLKERLPQFSLRRHGCSYLFCMLLFFKSDEAYTWCGKSLPLPCDLQMGGNLLWVCVLFSDLHYRVIFPPNVKFLPCMYWSIYFLY